LNILPRNPAKTSKREILLATLTVVSLVMVLGTGICAYSSWIASQRAAQQQSEPLKESQTEELLTRIQDFQQRLPSCNLTPVERAEVNSTLTKAIKELKSNGNAQAAQALFDSVQNVRSCPDVMIKSETTVAEVTTQTAVIPAAQVSLAFPMALVYFLLLAVAWRSERGRNKARRINEKNR
jgi:hypothetical protein